MISRTILTSSQALDESVSVGKLYERKKLDARLLGNSTKSPGALPYSSVIDAGTASLDIPSWTHAYMGKNQSYVITELSASSHETQCLNYFRSGTSPLEDSAVPMSSTLYFSKQSRYETLIVKKTASYLDTTMHPTSWTAVNFYPGSGTDVSVTTGSYSPLLPSAIYSRQGSFIFPARIPIEVNQSGRIVDIKVWIELVNVSGSGQNSGRYPLANLALAIRSPNVSWGHAHPIRNDEILKRVFTSDLSDFSPAGSFGNLGKGFFGPNNIWDFYRDTFILWEPAALFDIDGASTGPAESDNMYVTNWYPLWQKDRSMRTVFCDGASVHNPRHLRNASPLLNYSGAPSNGRGINSAIGCDVPWTSKQEFSGSNTHQAAGSPPSGWLTGPGGTNAVNEWPTTGVNYGATHIRPLYPLLDPLFQRKVYGNEYAQRNVGTSQAVFNPNEWVGFRPGLRGTEISGTWELIIGGGGGVSAEGFPYQALYFQQVRLEFTIERNRTPREIRKTRNVAPRRGGNYFTVKISGTDFIDNPGTTNVTGGWDAFVSDTYVQADLRSEIGTTYGVALNSGSLNPSLHALTYRLSGSLADLSGSAPGWLLNNRFGMPQIPESSASLVPYEPYAAVASDGILNSIVPQKTLDGPRRLADVARTVNPPQTMVELAADFASGSSI